MKQLSEYRSIMKIDKALDKINNNLYDGLNDILCFIVDSKNNYNHMGNLDDMKMIQDYIKLVGSKDSDSLYLVKSIGTELSLFRDKIRGMIKVDNKLDSETTHSHISILGENISMIKEFLEYNCHEIWSFSRDCEY